MKPNNINGKLTRTGVIVLEVFALELHDEEAKKQFSKDREKVFRTLIEHEGIEINKLTLLKKDEMSLLRRSFGSKLAIEGNFHIGIPQMKGRAGSAAVLTECQPKNPYQQTGPSSPAHSITKPSSWTVSNLSLAN